jgi:hypothetical protein
MVARATYVFWLAGISYIFCLETAYAMKLLYMVLLRKEQQMNFLSFASAQHFIVDLAVS